MTGAEYTASITASALASAAWGSPVTVARPRRTFFAVLADLKTSGASDEVACSSVTTCGRMS